LGCFRSLSLQETHAGTKAAENRSTTKTELDLLVQRTETEAKRAKMIANKPKIEKSLGGSLHASLLQL
jgi:hypothetical protein